MFDATVCKLFGRVLALVHNYMPSSVPITRDIQEILHFGISFSGSEKESLADRGDPNDPRVRLKRDCVGTMAAFRLKSPTCHHVIIANTHLYW